MKTPNLDKMVDCMKEQVEIYEIKGQLDELISECEAVSPTNCGWQEYSVAHIIVDYARYLRACRSNMEQEG